MIEPKGGIDIQKKWNERTTVAPEALYANNQVNTKQETFKLLQGNWLNASNRCTLQQGD